MISLNKPTYNQLIFNKGAKKMHRRKVSLQSKGLGKLDLHRHKSEASPSSPVTKDNSKCIEDLTRKHRILECTRILF
jgi:hypothetical protein